MSNVRFIADLHFSHENMALKRGFENADAMNNYIVSQWNKVVNKKDVTYILGDISMEKSTPYPLLSQLNGIKNVVMGNHDRKNHVRELLKFVDGVAGMIKYKNNILTHCPIHPSELQDRFEYNIHGHLHEITLDDPRYINVSCEIVDYTPKLLIELL